MSQSNILDAAKNAKSTEELKQIAVDNGITLTDEKATFYFSLLEEKNGELSLEELEAAIGGGLVPDQRFAHCHNWICSFCGSSVSPNVYSCKGCSADVRCRRCAKYIIGLGREKCAHFSDNGGGGGCG